MKKISTILTIVFAGLLGFSLYQYNGQVELNNKYVQKIYQLEAEIALLSGDIKSETNNTSEEMTIRFPVFIGLDPMDDDSYVFVEKQIPQSSSVLTATYTTLFNEESEVELPDGMTAQNAVPNSGLSFESVSIQDGKARVNLSGTYLGMHMSDPVFRKQINETAFQYPTVDTVEVVLNSQTFDWCIVDLSDGEGGCPEEPQLWIDEQ